MSLLPPKRKPSTTSAISADSLDGAATRPDSLARQSTRKKLGLPIPARQGAQPTSVVTRKSRKSAARARATRSAGASASASASVSADDDENTLQTAPQTDSSTAVAVTLAINGVADEKQAREDGDDDDDALDAGNPASKGGSKNPPETAGDRPAAPPSAATSSNTGMVLSQSSSGVNRFFVDTGFSSEEEDEVLGHPPPSLQQQEQQQKERQQHPEQKEQHQQQQQVQQDQQFFVTSPLPHLEEERDDGQAVSPNQQEPPPEEVALSISLLARASDGQEEGAAVEEASAVISTTPSAGGVKKVASTGDKKRRMRSRKLGKKTLSFNDQLNSGNGLDDDDEEDVTTLLGSSSLAPETTTILPEPLSQVAEAAPSTAVAATSGCADAASSGAAGLEVITDFQGIPPSPTAQQQQQQQQQQQHRDSSDASNNGSICVGSKGLSRFWAPQGARLAAPPIRTSPNPKLSVGGLSDSSANTDLCTFVARKLKTAELELAQAHELVISRCRSAAGLELPPSPTAAGRNTKMNRHFARQDGSEIPVGHQQTDRQRPMYENLFGNSLPKTTQYQRERERERARRDQTMTFLQTWGPSNGPGGGAVPAASGGGGGAKSRASGGQSVSPVGSGPQDKRPTFDGSSSSHVPSPQPKSSAHGSTLKVNTSSSNTGSNNNASTNSPKNGDGAANAQTPRHNSSGSLHSWNPVVAATSSGLALVVPKNLSRTEENSEMLDLQECWKATNTEHPPAKLKANKTVHRLSFGGEATDEESSRYGLDPSCFQRVIWDILTTMLVAYEVVTIPMEVFPMPDAVFFTVMEWLSRLFWTADIPLTAVTGYVEAETMRVEMRLSKTVSNYLRTWFFFDLLCVSFDWVELLLSSLSWGAFSKLAKNLVRPLRILRLIRILRLRRMEGFFEKVVMRIRGRWASISVSLTKTLLMVLFTAHFIACLWYGIGTLRSDGWVAVHEEEIGESVMSDVGYRYSTSLHWALTQFSGGMDEVKATNLGERLFVVTMYLVTFIAQCVFVSNLTSAMCKLEMVTSAESQGMSELKQFLQCNHVSAALGTRIMNNAASSIKAFVAVMPEHSIELLQYVSDPLRMELHFEMYADVLAIHPFFDSYIRACPQVMRQICHAAVAYKTIVQGDIIFSAGEEPFYEDGGQMVFVISGELKYVDLDGNFYVMQVGEFCAEPLLWLNWVYRGTLWAKTDSRICGISAKQFQTFATKAAAHLGTGFSPRRYAEAYIAEARKGEEFMSEVSIGNEEDILTHAGVTRPRASTRRSATGKSRFSRTFRSDRLGSALGFTL